MTKPLPVDTLRGCPESSGIAIPMEALSSPSARSRYMRSVLALFLGAAFLLTGCVSTGYLKAKKDTPPPQSLNVPFASDGFGAALNAVITFNGPGSWKRDAFWDEYVVTLHNPSSQALNISEAGLTDSFGTVRTAGDNPWKLEKESKTLEEKYKAPGVAFARYTVPGVVIVGGVGTLAFATAGGGYMALGAYGAVVGTAAVTVVVLPAYYGVVLTINHLNKVAMEKEFGRRRLVLPVTLAPGETRTGSFFFPMVPSPRSLSLHWSDEPGSGEAVLALDFLHDLHLKTPTHPSASSRADRPRSSSPHAYRGGAPEALRSTPSLEHSPRAAMAEASHRPPSRRSQPSPRGHPIPA